MSRFARLSASMLTAARNQDYALESGRDAQPLAQAAEDAMLGKRRSAAQLQAENPALSHDVKLPESNLCAPEVANSAHGFQALGQFGAKLCAHAAHMHVYRSRSAVIIESPHVLQQGIS